MKKNILQSEILSSFSEELLSNFFSIDDIDIDMNFIHFNNDHLLQSIFFKCPACLSDVKYVGSFIPRNTLHSLTPIYFCPNCGTIRTPQHTTIQHISRDTQEFSSVNNSLTSHLNFESRNRKLSQNLLSKFTVLFENTIELIVEIGCGPGWLLHEAQKKGIHTIGYDLATDSVEYGIKNLKLDLRNKVFSIQTVEELNSFIIKENIKNHVIICIMVIEHIQNPDDICKAIAFYCQKYKTYALISVPITDDLNDLMTSLLNINDEKSLFKYSPGHTCHYTQVGFCQLWKRHGASVVQRLKIPGSWQFLFLIKF